MSPKAITILSGERARELSADDFQSAANHPGILSIEKGVRDANHEEVVVLTSHDTTLNGLAKTILEVTGELDSNDGRMMSHTIFLNK